MFFLPFFLSLSPNFRRLSFPFFLPLLSSHQKFDLGRKILETANSSTNRSIIKPICQAVGLCVRAHSIGQTYEKGMLSLWDPRVNRKQLTLIGPVAVFEPWNCAADRRHTDWDESMIRTRLKQFQAGREKERKKNWRGFGGFRNTFNRQLKLWFMIGQKAVITITSGPGYRSIFKAKNKL